MAEYFSADAPPKRGERVEIPVHYDLWMQGARVGTVRSGPIVRHSISGVSSYVLVEMDHPQVRKLVKVRLHDWPYMKRIAA